MSDTTVEKQGVRVAVQAPIWLFPLLVYHLNPNLTFLQVVDNKMSLVQVVRGSCGDRHQVGLRFDTSVITFYRTASQMTIAMLYINDWVRPGISFFLFFSFFFITDARNVFLINFNTHNYCSWSNLYTVWLHKHYFKIKHFSDLAYWISSSKFPLVTIKVVPDSEKKKKKKKKKKLLPDITETKWSRLETRLSECYTDHHVSWPITA